MAKRTGLGRGLDALFADAAPINEEDYIAESLSEEIKASQPIKVAESDAEAFNTANKKSTSETKKASTKTASKDSVLYIDINDIKPNRAQPRKTFSEAALKELASSIRELGVIQPLIIRESENGYELVAGERRWRASRLAGLKKVPCIIKDYDEKQNAIVAIIENMQREDLNPIEEAEGLKSMTEKYGLTQEEVSNSIGKSRTYITNSIRLLKLPKEIQQFVSDGQMSAAHGRTIINITDTEKQKEICDKVIKQGLSVRETERIANKIKDEMAPGRKKRAATKSAKKGSDVLAVEAELRQLTGTKVNINGNDKNGKLELEYYSTEGLNHLIETIREAFK